LYTVVLLALNTGMRHSEIRLQQWKQIDFANRTLLVGKSKTENGTGRTIPLNKPLLAALQMWAANFPERGPEHYVFAAEEYGVGTNDFKPCVRGADSKTVPQEVPIGEDSKVRVSAYLYKRNGSSGRKRV
jgi:integrase